MKDKLNIAIAPGLTSFKFCIQVHDAIEEGNNKPFIYMITEEIQSKADLSASNVKYLVQNILALALYHYQESELNINNFSIERLNNDEYDINIRIVLPPEEGYADTEPYLFSKDNFILSIDGHTTPITYDFVNASMSNVLFEYTNPDFKL